MSYSCWKLRIRSWKSKVGNFKMILRLIVISLMKLIGIYYMIVFNVKRILMIYLKNMRKIYLRF